MVNELTVLTSIHVLAAAFWVGGGFLLNVAMIRAARSGDPTNMLPVMKLSHFAARNLFVPLSLIVLATGIWMTTDYYDWDLLWINLGLAGILFVLASFFYLIPTVGKRIAGAEAGNPPPPGRNWIPIIARTNLTVVSTVVVLMVIKPV